MESYVIKFEMYAAVKGIQYHVLVKGSSEGSRFGEWRLPLQILSIPIQNLKAGNNLENAHSIKYFFITNTDSFHNMISYSVFHKIRWHHSSI